MDDLFFYNEAEKKIGCCRWPADNLFFLGIIKKAITTDFFVPSQIDDLQEDIRHYASSIPVDLRKEAKKVFMIKNRERGGLWRQVGLIGSLIEIHGKLTRLARKPEDKDSWIDLYNYAIIALMSIRLKAIRIPHRDSKKVVVTGDEQGLGKAISDIFAVNGFEVVPYGIRRSLPEIQEFFDFFSYTKIDFLVNNYGINHLNWIGKIEEEDYGILDVNVKLPSMAVNELVARNMGPSRILNIVSQTYKVPQRCTSIYCASKAALAQMTKVMARELAPAGFVVNALAPGKIEDTRMSYLTDRQVGRLRKWSHKKAEQYALSMIPSGRFTDTEEVALAAIKIMHLPPYINGSIIDMTGGV